MRQFSTTQKIDKVNTLTAISPIDGRYANSVNSLRPYFSEFALMRFRVYVELNWFQSLFANQIVSTDPKVVAQVLAQKQYMDQLFKDFSVQDAERVKEIERTTNHDVKAIEYFLKEKFDENKDLAELKEYLHFSCTSEDINNLAYALMLHHSLQDVILPAMKNLQASLQKRAEEYADIPMMCRTHGQSATPSTMGKEIANFAYRLRL